MGTPTVPEEKESLLKKIEQLEAVQDQLKQEMSNLKLSSQKGHHHHRHRSHSLSPQRSRFRREAPPHPHAFNIASSSSASSSSPLQKETRSEEDPQQQHQQQNGAVNLTDRECLNILQSMGHSLHILDLQCRIIYWWLSTLVLIDSSSSLVLWGVYFCCKSTVKKGIFFFFFFFGFDFDLCNDFAGTPVLKICMVMQQRKFLAGMGLSCL